MAGTPKVFHTDTIVSLIGLGVQVIGSPEDADNQGYYHLEEWGLKTENHSMISSEQMRKSPLALIRPML